VAESSNLGSLRSLTPPLRFALLREQRPASPVLRYLKPAYVVPMHLVYSVELRGASAARPKRASADARWTRPLIVRSGSELGVSGDARRPEALRAELRGERRRVPRSLDLTAGSVCDRRSVGRLTCAALVPLGSIDPETRAAGVGAATRVAVACGDPGACTRWGSVEMRRPRRCSGAGRIAPWWGRTTRSDDGGGRWRLDSGASARCAVARQYLVGVRLIERGRDEIGPCVLGA
jgi:hypothetical protein